MILVIDCGNTNAKFAIWEEGKDEPRHTWRMPTNNNEIGQEYWDYRIASELLEVGIPSNKITGSLISSVVPNLTKVLVDVIYRVTGITPIVLSRSNYNALDIQLINPQEIGADLVANAVAAYDLFKQSCVVVDFGTALTFTSISEEGKLVGVAIAPGLKTAVKSLLDETAQLPEVPLEKPNSVLGKNTVEAIQAGIIIGGIGMVRHIINEIKSILGTHTKVVATGGLCQSNMMENLEDVFDKIDIHLTVKGLCTAAKQIAKNS